MKTWMVKQANAYTIARLIADQLDAEEHVDIHTLAVVAEVLTDAFDLDEQESKEFVATALANHDGYFAGREKYISDVQGKQHLKEV